MANFPHAFQKLFLATYATPFLTSSGKITTDLKPGQLGLMSEATKALIEVSNVGTAVYATNPLFVLCQGSFHTSDKLGPYHGGYQETVKSKGINPKYVSKFYKVASATPVNSILSVCASGCSLLCNSTYRLRVDVKGSPALRWLTHNLYRTVDAFTGCCTDPTSPAAVDPNIVLLQWADQLNSFPTTKDFISASVWNDTVTTDAEATADTFLTPTSVVGVAAGQRVVINPVAATTATGCTISGTTLTVTVVTANMLSVGMTITGTGVAVGTKIIGLGIGVGATGTYKVDISQTVSTFNDLSSSSDIIAFVKSTYAGGATVDLVTASAPYTATTTAVAAFSVAALTPVVFQTSITTATYVAKTATVDIAAVTSCLVLTGAYISTVFGDCSFNPKDHVEIEPLYIYASVVDISGDPCNVNCLTVGDVQRAIQGKGFGETVLREAILDASYRQEYWQQDPRMREVMDVTVVGDVSRSAKYDAYYILHSIPRKSNPSGTFDNDQYLIKIAIPSTATQTTVLQFVAWMNAILTSAGNNVQLENLA